MEKDSHYNPDRIPAEEFYSFNKILNALAINQEILSKKESAFAIKNFASSLALTFTNHFPEVQVVFATGYPFYLNIDSLPENFFIQEFMDFNKMTEDKVRQA